METNANSFLLRRLETGWFLPNIFFMVPKLGQRIVSEFWAKEKNLACIEKVEGEWHNPDAVPQELFSGKDPPCVTAFGWGKEADPERKEILDIEADRKADWVKPVRGMLSVGPPDGFPR